MSLETFKTLAETAESIVTAGGIVAAGIWTYLIFVRRRQRFPRATVSHQMHHFRLPDGRTLLRVAAKISNIGDVVVCLRTITTRVQHLLPLPEHIDAHLMQSCDPANGDCEFPWPVLGKREWRIDETLGEVEPGEAEVLQSDFVIPAGVEQVVVYTHVPNHAKSETGIGWSETVIVSLTEERDARGTAAAATSISAGVETASLPSRPSSADHAAASLPAGPALAAVDKMTPT